MDMEMIIDYLVPKTGIYNLRIPDDMINSEIEIIIKRSNRITSKNEIEEIISNTSGIINNSNLNPIDWQRKIRDEWE